MFTPRRTGLFALFAGLMLAFSMVSVDYAEARRGGSFGSRGLRTHQSAPATRTAPNQAAPVERSMTPNTAPNAARQPAAGQQRPGFMNGLGGSLMRGLLIGGLIGLLLGQGFGGLAGLFGLLLQGLLIAGVIMLALRFFRGQNAAQPAMAGAGSGNAPNNNGFGRQAHPAGDSNKRAGFTVPSFGGQQAAAQAPAMRDMTPGEEDLNRFEALLGEVQDAFSREDYAGLRRLVTPEMVSYLSEELAQNTHNGLRNEVSDVRLLEADIAESWSEGNRDYATAALRYEAIELMRDRTTGKVVEGDADTPSETVELWTFVRENGQDWKLSAIQQPG
ncbi:Tim44 domain-containing protein [Aquamicrobium sp.]|uniref:Tim44 domain-containing protein n=1 Tax=Aquamicrobium sp. TaxID=1872579 RepID=UPI00258CE75B|nr:Tim44 domain-containing protein [Aquamicrobium sp.]MCK9550082.1 Tim44 domain-containing protein [Aquamicrobium sp.]